MKAARVLVGALVWLALPAVGAGQASLSPAYESAVRRYAAGDRGGAVAAAAALPERQLRSELEALRALRRRARACEACADAVAWQRAPLLAALMLHGDVWLQELGSEPARWHEAAAAALAELLKDDAARRGFVERWYGVMAGVAQDRNRWDEARAWAVRGLAAFPGDPGLLLVKGAIEETVAALAAAAYAEDVLDPSFTQTAANLARLRDTRQQLAAARDTLRAALRADPALDEARLRIARVAWRLGEPREARAALDEVLLRTGASETASLAHLIGGRLSEDAGRLDEASRSYQAAIALHPSGQAARLALSHVHLLRGDTAAARAEVEAALGPAGRRERRDPFWDYPWGAAARVRDRFEALRLEAARETGVEAVP